MSWNRFSLLGFLLLLLLACSAPPRPNPAVDSSKAASQAIGLNAEYFGNAKNKERSLKQIDSRIAFNWGSVRAAKGLRPDGNFSARWTGYLEAKYNEEYTFYLTASGKADLYLNNQLIASDNKGSGKLKLTAGQKLPIRLEFKSRANAKDAALLLEWQSKSQKRQIIPPTRFYPEAASASANPNNPITFNPLGEVGKQSVPSGTQLLTNADFEQSSGGWVKYGGGTFTTVTPGRSGSGNAAKTTSWTYAEQTLPYAYVSAGTSYTLEAYAKSPNSVNCRVGVAGGGSGGDFDYPLLTFNTSSWEKKTAQVTLPSGATWAVVYVLSDVTTNQECQYDDLLFYTGTLTDPGPPPATSNNLLSNPGFEQDLAAWNTSTGSPAINPQGHTNKAAQFNAWSWIEQGFDNTQFQAGQTYVMKGWLRSTSNEACTIGLLGGNDTQVTFDLSYSFYSPSWVEKYVSQALPADTTWILPYLSGSTGCLFDDLVLGKQSTTPPPVGTQAVISLVSPVAFANQDFYFDGSASTGNGLSYSWNFGDGSTATGVSAVHKYTQPGSYTATLTVTDAANQSHQATASITILPQVDNIATSPTISQGKGTEVLSLDAGNPVPGLTYTWDLGDGNTKTGSRVTHEYQRMGLYEVKLTIRDPQGLYRSNLSKAGVKRLVNKQDVNDDILAGWTQIYGAWGPAPKAKFTLSTQNGSNVAYGSGQAPLTVAFDASATTGNGSLSYQWEFGQGGSLGTATGQTASFTFPVGKHLITLKVTDNKARTDTYRTWVYARDLRTSDVLLRFDYPTLTQALAQTMNEPQGVVRNIPTRRDISKQDVGTQGIGGFNDYFPYIVHNSATLFRGSIYPKNDDGSRTTVFCDQMDLQYNNVSRPDSAYVKLGFPGDPDFVCRYFLFTSSAFPNPLLSTAPSSIKGITNKYDVNFEFDLIAGLRVPKVNIAVIPDALFDGSKGSPSVSEYSLNEGGTNKLALTVRVPKSVADATGAVEFRLPVYAVDGSGLLSQANGIFPARLDAPQISNVPGDAVMVNGKAYVTVRVPINIADTIDFTRFSLGPNAACGSDNTTALSFNRLYLNGCTTVTATNDVPGNAPQLEAFSFPATTATLSKFNRISYGTTAKEQTDYTKNVANTSIEVAKFLFNFVPFLSDTADILGQAYNAFTGQPTDKVLLVLASAGLILDAATTGTADVTAPFKAIYKYSRGAAGALAQGIEEVIVGAINTGKTAGQTLDELGALIGTSAKLIFDCGLQCLKSSDIVVKRITNGGVSAKDAFKQLDEALKETKDFGVNQQVYLRIADFLGSSCGIVSQRITTQATCDPTKALDTLRSTLRNINVLPSAERELFGDLNTIAAKMDELCCKWVPAVEGIGDLLRDIAAAGNDIGNVRGYLTELEWATRLNKRTSTTLIALSRKLPFQSSFVDIDVLSSVGGQQFADQVKASANAVSEGLAKGQLQRLIEWAAQNNTVARVVVGNPGGLTVDLKQAVRSTCSNGKCLDIIDLGGIPL